MSRQAKPHICQCLVTHLCVVWSRQPELSIYYFTEFPVILLYREILVDESCMADSVQCGDSISRLLLLEFLQHACESVVSASDATCSYRPQFLQALDGLVVNLVKMNLLKTYSAQSIIGSERYGEKLRCWQALCVLSPYLSESTVCDIVDSFFMVLTHTCAHPIRVHLEVFGSSLAKRFPVIVLRKLSEILSSYDHVQQTLSSYFVMIGHLVVGVDGQSLVATLPLSMANDLLTLLLPWLACANSLPRAIAQLVVFSIIPVVVDLEKSPNNDPYFSSLRNIYRNMSQNKETLKILERQRQFYANYSLSKLTTVEGLNSLDNGGVGQDIVPSHILTVLHDTIKENMAEELLQEEAFKARPYGDSKYVDTLPTKNRTMQTKRIPYDDLAVAIKDHEKSRHENMAGRKRQSIVVVASLLDKAINIAGLARTCEILAVEELVVDSLAITKTSDFLNIAVSSGTWLPMKEVSTTDLSDYLHYMKRNGYTVLGIEQTDSSVSLEKLQLPEKCVLLLGKEKEGIPVEYLQQVDLCVEIPQFGIIRSLNVHVCASIILWEYTRQNLISPK